LPQRVGGDRLHLLGQLFSIARHERDLLLGRGAQLRDLPLVRGLALVREPRSMLGFQHRMQTGRLQIRLVPLNGNLQFEAHHALSVGGNPGRIDRGSQPRNQQDRHRRSTGKQPDDERHDRSPRCRDITREPTIGRREEQLPAGRRCGMWPSLLALEP
jgi:hypothetical protein